MQVCIFNFSLIFLLVFFSCKQSDVPPNFILIIIDDQNMQLSCYGNEYIHTPTMDMLASQGIRFTHAYVQQAVCAASRASFLTGLHPESTGVEYPYSYYFVERVIPTYGTIGQYFLQNGYDTRYFGKVHHGYEETLNEPNYNPGGTRYVSPENIRIDQELGNLGVPPFEKFNGPDSLFRDGRIANAVVNALTNRNIEQPFLYVVGFAKPHLPFSAPEKYWDLYDRENLPLAQNSSRPIGFPDIAISRYNLRQYKWEHDNPDSLFSNEYSGLLRQAYFACTSFVDAQLGKINEQLEKLGVSENTYIVYLSDHGFHLGEQNHWGKTTLYESSLRSPLIISRKGMKNSGSTCEALIEYVDIMPTLLELANIDRPVHLEGVSTVPLLNNPDQKFKKAVFSRQERDIIGRKKGYSVRNDRYRYTEWHDHENSKLIASELYDLQTDPLETNNLAIDTTYQYVIDIMSKILQTGWKKALPDGIMNRSNNPAAPPAYAWGPEGAPRRAVWHEIYGGNETEGWEIATEVRMDKAHLRDSTIMN